MTAGITAHIWASEKGGLETDIDTCLVEFKSNAHRNIVRRKLEDCFSALWGDKAKAIFGDEAEID